ncbi:MAG TPA: hypothetical protein DCP92_07990 [Nitrospiraceae bacterium]|jgi:hypothetical protein|nr:hypothetical protein [Nitrospiraceae bacterium]
MTCRARHIEVGEVQWGSERKKESLGLPQVARQKVLNLVYMFSSSTVAFSSFLRTLGSLRNVFLLFELVPEKPCRKNILCQLKGDRSPRLRYFIVILMNNQGYCLISFLTANNNQDVTICHERSTPAPIKACGIIPNVAKTNIFEPSLFPCYIL